MKIFTNRICFMFTLLLPFIGTAQNKDFKGMVKTIHTSHWEENIPNAATKNIVRSSTTKYYDREGYPTSQVLHLGDEDIKSNYIYGEKHRLERIVEQTFRMGNKSKTLYKYDEEGRLSKILYKEENKLIQSFTYEYPSDNCTIETTFYAKMLDLFQKKRSK